MSKLDKEYLSDPVVGRSYEEPKQPVAKSRQDADETLVYTETTVAPDGGYGWIILIASFFVNCIVDGLIFSFGVLERPLDEEFGGSGVAWVGSCMAGFYLLAGPVVSGLCNKYGARIITMTGALIAATALATSYLSTSISVMIVLYGIIGGIGFGFAYLPSIVIVGEYFEKRRAFATGIAVSGSGVGGFVFAVVFEILVDHYGWRGAVLIIAGIALNCAVFGSLFRPLKPIRRLEEVDTNMPRSDSFLQRIEDARNARINKLNVEAGMEMNISPRKGEHAGEHDTDKRVELTYVPGSNGGLNEVQRVRISQTNLNRRHSTASRKSGNMGSMHNVLKPDALYAGSLHNLPEVIATGGSVQDFRQAVGRHDVDGSGKGASKCDAVMGVLKQMLDVSLLKSPTFLLTCVASFLTLAGFFIPFFYIKKLVESEAGGLEKSQGTQVLQAISITNTIGRILVGFASDYPKVDPIVVACSSLILGGVATFFAPYYSGFAMFIIYALTFGLAMSAFAALRSIILVDLFGIAMLNNSFGLQMVFQGIATLIGSPVAGAIAAATGTTDSAFYFAGALLTTSGILLFPAKLLKRWEKRRYPGNFSN